MPNDHHNWIAIPLINGIGLKRMIMLIAGTVLLAAGVSAAVTRAIPADVVRDAVRNEIQAATGLDPAMRGPISLAMFPATTVSFSDVVLDGHTGEEPAFAVDELIANLRLLPLLAGRIEIADIALVRPRIVVSIEADGHTNWSALVDTLARALNPNARRDERVLSFSEIRISDGVIALRHPGRHVNETVTGVELSLAWPSIAKSFAATGHFSWHDQLVNTSVGIADFPAALAGEGSGVKFRANGGPLKAAFDGVMSFEPSVKLDGTLAADAPSLREALRWSGGKSLPEGGLGRFALKARAAVDDGTVSLSNLNVELDGNVAEGVLSYAVSGRQTLQGTLAVEKLDLRPYVSSFRLVSDNSRDWDRSSIGFDWINGWEADLRLSAAGVTFSRMQLGRTAVAAGLRDGRLTISIGESQSFGGLVTGTIALAKQDLTTEIKSQMQFANVELEKCLGELFGIHRIDGIGSLTYAVESAGAHVEELTRNINGSAQLVARQGALTGVNVEQILRRLQRSPLSGSGDFRNGRTAFDMLNVNLQVAHGIATVTNVRLEGTSLRVLLGGTGSIPDRELDLSGTASLIGAADSNVSFDLPFAVQGPWDSPLLFADPQTLIRRSGATGPLLDALQDRRNREGVQNAIERLIRPSGIDRTPR